MGVPTRDLVKTNFARSESGPGQHKEDPTLGKLPSHTHSPAPDRVGVLPSSEPEPWIRHEIYFGQVAKDGTPVPAGLWEAFASANLPACFPEGYTVLEAAGGWSGPDGRFIREPSRVVVAFLPAGQTGVGLRVAALALCWKQLARQECLLWASSPATVATL